MSASSAVIDATTSSSAEERGNRENEKIGAASVAKTPNIKLTANTAISKDVQTGGTTNFLASSGIPSDSSCTSIAAAAAPDPRSAAADAAESRAAAATLKTPTDLTCDSITHHISQFLESLPLTTPSASVTLRQLKDAMKEFFDDWVCIYHVVFFMVAASLFTPIATVNFDTIKDTMTRNKTNNSSAPNLWLQRAE